MRAMDTASTEPPVDPVLGRIGSPGRHRPRWSPSGGVPATRDLELTLWAVLLLSGVAIVLGTLLRRHGVSGVAFAAAGAALILALALLCAITSLTPPALRAERPWSRRAVRVAVVGTAASALDLLAALRDGGVSGVEVVGAISPGSVRDAEGPALGGLDEARRIVETNRIDIVLIGPGVSRRGVVDTVMRECEGARVRVCDMAAFYEDVFGHVPITEVDSSWFQYLLHPRYRDRASQRVVDVIVASVLAVVFLPVICVAAVVIRLDGGPALFRQVRVGRDGRTFVMYKLRTMRPGEDSTGWTLDGDPRITSFGRILRRIHLDELPQLVNVLRGDMTLVGPRPEQPDVVVELEGALPLWRGRHRYKPGLTGWAQVHCGYAGSHDGSARKLAHDLYYLRHHSLALDAAILVQTASLLVAPRVAAAASTPFLVRRADEAATPLAVPGRTSSRAGRAGVKIPRTAALVTGGAGFIGSQLADVLLESGYDVVAVDDLSCGRPENLAQALSAGARLEAASVLDAEAMLAIFMAVRPQVVFHLAAQVEVSRAVADPMQDAMANVVGTLAVLEAARACGVQRFVLASSGGAVYGDAALIPTPEHAAMNPLSPYGAAKIAAEHYTALYGRLYGMSTMALRLANVYGPRQGAGGEGGVVARFCRAQIEGAHAQVFGDGRQTRDYIHVQDVVAAFVAAGRSAATGALNIGTRTETTVLELVHGLGLASEFRPERLGEVARSCLDPRAAAGTLGWRPRIALEDGLADTLAFMSRFHEERTARAV
jgi:UDP-glucose 4-epimerase